MKTRLQKILLLGVSITCMNTIVTAQSPTVKWEATFGGTNENSGGGESGTKIFNTASGGYIVCGNTYATNIPGGKGGVDAALVAYDSAGAELWHKSYGGTGAELVGNMDKTAEGGYILSGLSNSNNGDVSGNHGAQDIMVIKTDDTGQVIWTKLYGGTGADGLRAVSAGITSKQVSIKALSGGGYILSGPTASNNGDVSGNHGMVDVWVARLNDTGAILWSHCYGGTLNDVPNGEIFQTADGGFIVGATTESSDGDVTGYHGNSDLWLIKMDSTGTLQWQKTLGGSGLDILTAGVSLVEDGYVLAGTSRSGDGDVNALGGGTWDWWVVKVDDTGDVVWSKSFGNTGTFTYDYLLGTTVAKDGGMLLSGVIAGSTDNSTGGIYNGIGNGSNITGPLFGGNDAWIVKLTTSGDIAWQKVVGTTENEQFQSVIQRNDGSITTTGYLKGLPTGTEWWTVHFSACPGYSYIADTICKGASFAFGSQNLSVAGSYIDTLIMTENGCDSFVTLALYVDSVITPVITANGTLLGTGNYHSYQWLDGNNIPIANATAQTYQPLASGSYKVVVGNERGCSDTSAAFTSTILGITDPAAFAGLKLYPNPATTEIYLEVPANINTGTIMIGGIDGSILESLEIESGKQKYTLPVNQLLPGVYFIKIATNEGVALRKWTKL